MGKIALPFLVATTLVLMGCGFMKGSTPPESVFEDRQVVSFVKAAASGNILRMDDAIVRGVDVNSSGKDNITPLYWMLVNSRKPNMAGFQHLLDLGADPLVSHAKSGYSALILSARKQENSYLAAILNSGADPNHFHSGISSKPSALFHTIETYAYGNLALLLSYGADTEIRNSLGETAIHHTRINNWRAAYMLLEAGADYSAKTEVGDHTIVTWLESNRYWPTPGEVDWREKVVDFLRDREVEVNPWMPPEE